MNTKVLTYLAIGYAIIMTVAVVYLCMQEKQLVIQYPDVKTSNIEYHPIYYILQLPKHITDVVEIYKDSLENEHQVYSDKLEIKNDSLEVSIGVTTDINLKLQEAEWNWSDIKIKTFEKIVTKIVEIPKYITEYKSLPFYMNEWFYYSLGETVLLILFFWFI